jgi:FkbM family methyltransferase
MRHDDLIYDVGMHNGDDTAFYLSRNFRVVAIEADPTLAESGRSRFRREISDRRLTILNVGISDREGKQPFWICETKSEWNSFDRRIASRDGLPHHSISIPTRRFASILREFGIPYYLKIDIEGKDRFCLEDLATVREEYLPPYVSWENDIEPGQNDASALRLLHELGYSRFKLIDQSTYAPVVRGVSMSNFIDAAGWHLARRLGPRLAGTVRNHLTYRGILERRFAIRFPMGCSGPWGDDMPGSWMTYPEAAATVHAATNELQKSSRPAFSFWCDWHASL